jgi:hypothetical protein
MATKLVVTNLFANFKVGQEISDPASVARYAASHPSYVVKVQAVDPPAAVAAPPPPKPEA